ncbi:hypothetical protein DYB25_002244 [Aphanomyces astaci]|uniref:Uncharacterized protein n=1 Tax=Aphanomyces astaci TaxID=112090 RepID=A0A397DHD7_APHAT|nr:hypothetical protein DYB25_002244 [Aphanomyces astaci]RHY64485.1 hypothetical protein DYB38_009211 [Aphanomyces astaci]RHZ33870.1 hypothetical protein DYB26_007161 [Aphanomyces astaci]
MGAVATAIGTHLSTIFTTPVGQAIAFASVAGYLTYYYVGDITNWSIQDFGFVVAVTAIVLLHRYRLKSYIEHDPTQRILDDVVPVAFIAVTQESREDLDAYEVHGRQASNFKSLNTFGFAIAIEDGTLTKEYQLKHNVNTLPHVYLVGRDDTIFWHGHPLGHFDVS